MVANMLEGIEVRLGYGLSGRERKRMMRWQRR